MALSHNEQLDALFRAVLSLQSVDECYRYFEDICTIHELESIAQRQAVASMLSDGMSYQQTIAGTGASSATISRVKRCLEHGAGGYTLVLSRMKEESTDASQTE